MPLHRALLFLVILLMAAPAWAQERRVALVVGADSYRNIPPLLNAVSDARALGQRLGALGFEVVGPILDPTREQFLAALDEFDRRLQGADAGMFFFAGHAVEVRDRNLLLPIDAPAAQSLRQLEAGAIPVSDILNEMQARTPRVILILDACRDNPLPRDATRGGAPALGATRGLSTRGLEPIQPTSGPGGRFVVFAAEPGATALDRLPDDPPGANGLFTRHLLRALDQADRPINQLMSEVRDRVAEAASRAGRQQVPHIDDRMVGSGNFMLARAVARPAQALPGAPAPSALAPEALELAFWQSIQSSQNPAEFEAYLARFPSGTFSALARNRMEALRPPAQAQPVAMPVPSAAALRALTRDEISGAQRLLNALGFDTGGTDGSVGPRTRQSMERFAQAMLRPDDTDFDTANLARLEGALRDFQRLTERPANSPRNVPASSIIGAADRFQRGWTAERATPPDPTEAAFWYGLAAREHDARALNQLGLLLVRGQGVTADAAGGSLLWRLAAVRGDATAAFNLGAMLERGIGLARNVGWARYWYNLAAQSGHPQAREALRRMGS